MVPCSVPTSIVQSLPPLLCPKLHRQSQGYPGTPSTPKASLWQSIPEHWSYTGSPGIILGLPYPPKASLWQSIGITPAVPGLSWDSLTLQQSIPEHRSYTGSPVIILGLSHPPQHPCGRVSQNTRVTPVFWDTLPQGYSGIPLWWSIPECQSNTGVERQEKLGILEKIQTAQWAAPSVPVPKPNGAIHICVSDSVWVIKFL